MQFAAVKPAVAAACHVGVPPCTSKPSSLRLRFFLPVSASLVDRLRCFLAAFRATKSCPMVWDSSSSSSSNQSCASVCQAGDEVV
jgi:hypothetical protein